MVAELVDYVVGVDTHRDEQTLALVEAAERSGAGAEEHRQRPPLRRRFASRQQAEGARLWALVPVSYPGEVGLDDEPAYVEPGNVTFGQRQAGLNRQFGT